MHRPRRAKRQQQHVVVQGDIQHDSPSTPHQAKQRFHYLFSTPHTPFEKVAQRKRVHVEEEYPIMQGKHAHVRFAQCTEFVSPHCAVKSQSIRYPKRLSDKSYRELLILEQVTMLCNERKCSAFVRLYDWFKSEQQQQEGFYQMHLVLERGQDTLFGYIVKQGRSLCYDEFRSILFQLLFSLQVAQEELYFTHNDLHLKNILVKQLPSHVQQTCYSWKGQTWCFSHPPHSRYLVKMTDFGLSRIRLPSSGEELQNHPSDTFDCIADVQKLGSELGSVKITGSTLTSQQKQWVRDIKRQMSMTGALPSDLLQHPMFQECQISTTNTTTNTTTTQTHSLVSHYTTTWYFGDALPITATPPKPHKTPQKQTILAMLTNKNSPAACGIVGVVATNPAVTPKHLVGGSKNFSSPSSSSIAPVVLSFDPPPSTTAGENNKENCPFPSTDHHVATCLSSTTTKIRRRIRRKRPRTSVALESSGMTPNSKMTRVV